MDSYFTEEAPVIDGVMSEKLWSNARQVTGFTTFVPDYSKKMELRTTAYWSHDDDNLYFAFRCEDDPKLIKTSLAARDKISQDDWVCINLDSFNDRQTLYGFYINPNGIQMDSRFAGGRDDPWIDMIWYSAATIDGEGYTVEVQIPFKSIRYAVQEGNVDMGVIFERKVSRLSTQGTYPALDPNQGLNFLTQTMPLHFEGVKKNTLLEILPAVTHARSKEHLDGVYDRESETQMSLTAKYGITSDLILDATINPDFSQVEADALQVQVNQRFPVFFPERRPFFQEGSEHFSHSGGSGSSEIRRVVNTRSIVRPLTAGKITGKIGKSNIISAIGAVDQLDTAYNANVGVFRYKRAFRKDSYLGGFWTGRTESDFENMVYGLDGRFRISDASLVSGYLFNSATSDFEESSYNNRSAGAANYSYRNRNVSVGGGYTNIEVTLPRNTRFEISGNKATEIYESQRFDRSSVGVEGRSQVHRRVFLAGEYRLRNRIYYDEPAQGYGESFEGTLTLQVNDNFNADLNYNYTDLFRKGSDEKFYEIHIIRSRNTYQINKYLFLRAILQYDSYEQLLTPNFLASFTYIPGTVVHIGYGSVMERTHWDREAAEYVDSRRFFERSGALFFKASYLWRL
ncbi:unnamed protein product [Symbiodinium microadriaticum]|nr:unnamed protein product [Symbiodinium microadriaticum]